MCVQSVLVFKVTQNRASIDGCTEYLLVSTNRNNHLMISVKSHQRGQLVCNKRENDLMIFSFPTVPLCTEYARYGFETIRNADMQYHT